MTLTKRLIAGITAAVLALSVSGCANRNEWVKQSDNATLSSGEYIFHILNQVSEAYNLTGLPSAYDVFEKQIDGQNVEDWVTEQVEFQSKLHLAINERFEDLGLSFSSAEASAIQSEVDSNFSSFTSYYGQNTGVSEETYYSVMELNYKESMILNTLYGTGGEKEVSEADLEAYYKNHAAKYLIMSFTKSGDDDGTNEGYEETIANYLERINAGGESFSDIYVEYYTEQQYSVTEASYSTYFDNDSMDETLKQGVFYEAEVGGDAIMVESDYSYFMIQRFDHMEDETEVSGSLGNALASMKREELENDLIEWLAANRTVKVNDSMIKKYDILTVFSTKNS